MYIPLKIVSDYSLLKSLIKIKDLVNYLNEESISACGLCDINLFGSMEFHKLCQNHNIKPIFGLDVKINNLHIYLYAKNNNGFKHLIKINSITQERELTIDDLDISNIKIIIPYKSKELLNIYPESYIGYETEQERVNSLLLTNNVVFVNEITMFRESDKIYLDYLKRINGDEIDSNNREFNYFPIKTSLTKDDILSTEDFSRDINVFFDNKQKYIPVYKNKLNDSFKYLCLLAKKGLEKRFNSEVSKKCETRLNYELKVIKDMGYVDYFLIVYDYVLFAKKNNIFVGPGRGSAAGSLVSYSLGITDIYPLKYNLLFERFLNPERITMPDIDIDFEYTKRHLVVEYVKDKYNSSCVAPIMTYGTLASKQVLRDVAKIFKINEILIDKFVKVIEAKESLSVNKEHDIVKKFLNNNPELKEVYKVALKLEGLKRHISTHAAGIVICSKPLDNIIPLYISNNEIMTGYTMEYLEELGLLKMDFLALKNLTVISNVLSLIKNHNMEDIKLNNIDFEDKRVYRLFQNAETEGIFQFESQGMKNMLRKLKPTCFNDLIASIALFRPGPMDNIDSFIARKDGKEKIDYLDPSLESILKETYGIIVYQEQIMLILVKMAKYSFAEADNVRRAMSKKKEDIIIKEKENFINKSIDNGYNKDVSEKVYELILKFANYGFPKAHAVAYSTIAYQMAYLKALYPLYFITNLLNMAIGNEEKTKEYLSLAKKNNLKIAPININKSTDHYQIVDKEILLPLSIIKNIGTNSIKEILNERQKGPFVDYCDFVARTYNKGVNKLMIENLIKVNAFNDYKINRKTLMENIPIVINYASLIEDLDESLVMKPVLEEFSEYQEEETRDFELETLGFYLTNHPASRYSDSIKIESIAKYFDKVIETYVLVENIKKTKTKKNDDMAFLTISDETSDIEAVVFSSSMNYLNGINKKDLVKITGRVMKRFDKFNINIIKLTKI